MEDYGLVSIITPSYNCAAFIGETIESILSQTYQNWELLITDDCSSDNSREIINEYCARDSRIKLFKLEKNSGAGVARNNSIEEARGRYKRSVTVMTDGIRINWKSNSIIWRQRNVLLVTHHT